MTAHDRALGALTYSRRPRAEADALIAAHVPMVRRVAWHVHGRVSSAIEIDDLVQMGMVALIEAARAYEDRGHAFATYAMTRVRGAMIDGLRRSAAQGRSGMAKRRALDAARAAFARDRGRAPDDGELAEAMSLTPAALRALIDAAQAVRHESIDDLYSDHSMWFAADTPDAEDVLSSAQLHDALRDAIATLPTREATVLQLYFVEELNLAEIGAVLGVGEARVCQIKKAALDKMRALLQSRSRYWGINF